MVLTTEISVFPNPFDYFIILEITCEEPLDCIVLLADLGPGKIVRMMGAGFRNGINRVSLDGLHTLGTGQYQLDIKTIDGDVLYQTILIKL
ncbi:MAG TPA: hypothetical protein VFE32_22460 [Puia sp.]|jgi:hypothetical protein|nr:hypothetical protein [Puia sp.]